MLISMGATKAEQSPSPANFPQPEGTPNGFHHLTHKLTRQRTESIAEFYDRLGGVPLPLFVLQRGHHGIKDVF